MKHNHNEHYVRLHSVDVIVFDLDFWVNRYIASVLTNHNHNQMVRLLIAGSFTIRFSVCINRAVFSVYC